MLCASATTHHQVHHNCNICNKYLHPNVPKPFFALGYPPTGGPDCPPPWQYRTTRQHSKAAVAGLRVQHLLLVETRAAEVVAAGWVGNFVPVTAALSRPLQQALHWPLWKWPRARAALPVLPALSAPLSPLSLALQVLAEVPSQPPLRAKRSTTFPCSLAALLQNVHKPHASAQHSASAVAAVDAFQRKSDAAVQLRRGAWRPAPPRIGFLAWLWPVAPLLGSHSFRRAPPR
mmetsp:Transcript_5573/g.11764  ORF Transcript_5573/g.11764 Transcript_5573/m.11764 type:complete len:232 (-) Transcript_5573:1122-1817(-)